jgi:L,D-peptidoglycan transpeptidase YkuD (ErfK/YbiS/YcfS/YnhG family)
MGQTCRQRLCPAIPATAQQLILVLADNWDGFRARLYLCEKIFGAWRVDQSFPAVCGQNGMAWGLGLYPASLARQPQPGKREGDRKTPAGIFQLGACMGYAPELADNSSWSYQQLTPTMQGVDDPKSQYYNRVMERAQLEKTGGVDWNSHEVMRRADDLYKWLLVINHNPDNIPGCGSLIFMHLWKDEFSGTAGCTALPENAFLKTLSWLDPAQGPILGQLPQAIYREKQTEWALPLV